MSSFTTITIIILSCSVLALSQFTDFMQVYEQECLAEDKVHCSDGSCIWRHQHCDGKDDCPDGSDEELCLGYPPDPDKCRERNHYLCADAQLCIPPILVCDNETDCDDGSDEANCTEEVRQANSSCSDFKCASDGRCISLRWLCDGEYDCADKSDEHPDTCRHRERHPWETCTNPATDLAIFKYHRCGDHHRCIKLDEVCNGRQDCKNGSDEGDFCKTWNTTCKESSCNSIQTNATCYPIAGGYGCDCHKSFHEYNHTTQTCDLVNLCDTPWPQCSQFCEYKEGPISCACEEGYMVDRLSIGHVCFAPEPEAMLFFSTGTEIGYFTMKSKKTVIVAKGKEVHGVAYDGQFVYWVETAHGHQAIVSADVENVAETKQVLVSLGLEDPGDIAVDWRGGHLYFSDVERGVIAVCRIEGAMCATLNTTAKLPKFLQLNVYTGKMYWADWQEHPVIMSASMDGAASRVFVRATAAVGGLAVDHPGGRLYFYDGELKGARLDNGKVYVLSSELLSHPYTLSVFENMIYWSDLTTNSVQMMHKISWDKAGVLFKANSSVYDIHMFHPILLRAGKDPCRRSNCTHLCLLTSNGTSACACPDGMVLVDGTDCENAKGYRPQFLVVGSGAKFTRVQYNALGNPELEASNFDIGRVQAMAYDSLRDAIYVYDGIRKSINYITMGFFTRGDTRVLLNRGLLNVVDLDYDYVTDTLYILDAGRRFIEVFSLALKKRAILYRFDNEIPISMCLMPEYGKMLIAVMESEENNNVHIDSFSLDGTGRRHILLNDLKGPLIKLKYSHAMDNVYIADDGNRMIDHMHPIGTGREPYRELTTSVTNLAVTDTLVFWTDSRSNRLYWADIHDTSRYIRRLEFTIFPNNSLLHLQATSQPSSIPRHPCQDNPCSDVCVQTKPDLAFLDQHPLEPTLEPKYKCLCPPGLLLVDNSCSELVMCKEDEAFCHNSNVCIKRKLVCDGKKDCQHGEDEDGCGHSPIVKSGCAHDEILCEGKCIHKNQICKPSTPASVPATTICTSTQFRCADGDICLERSQVCDHVPDCSDQSDEDPTLCATFNCLESEFMCSSGQCVLKSFKCDGQDDCQDGSDEISCPNKTCGMGYYQCRDMECIELHQRCDGQMDCADSSDEDDCDDPDLLDVKEEVENCEAWEFPCEHDRTICLPLSARCNGKVDCPGSTDEENCEHTWLTCRGRSDWFPCSQESTCLPPSRVCDGKRDCGDGSDESALTCQMRNKTSHLNPSPVYPRNECHKGFQCRNGQCLEWHEVCDHQPHCYDGTDEGGNCSTACKGFKCTHTCHPTPTGGQCICMDGYTLGADRYTCQDEDECVKDVCSHRCTNTVGSFVCACHRGYALRSDRRSCKATNGHMSVYYVTGNSVRSITADGHIAVEYNDENVPNIIDMDVDVRKRNLYVTSINKLIQVNGDNQTTITNVGRPTKVAVDWISGNVYFVDSTPAASYVRVCNVEKRKCARLQKLTKNADVTALVVDPVSRRMFYCITRDLESIIWSATLSGRQVTQIAVVHNCTGLALDSYKKLLYIAETAPAQIASIDFEGNHMKQILTNEKHLEAPHDLAMFEDHAYFLVANSFRLNRCLLFGQKHCELYLQRVFNANTFVIHHESVQRDDIPDVCDSECDGICVPEDMRQLCLCDDGSIAKGDCVVVAKDLPLFNGWPAQDYRSVQNMIQIVIIVLVVAVLLYLFGYVSYQSYKRGWLSGTRDNVNYLPGFRVYFQNRQAEAAMNAEQDEFSRAMGQDIFSQEVVEVEVQDTAGSSRHEFSNPLQYLKHLKLPFRKPSHPVGTAGLTIEVPRMDVSDTESDLDDRESRRILAKKNSGDS